jgi:dihydroxyacetone kinase-like predicted kinase
VADLLGSAGVGIVPAAARQRPSTAELLDAMRLTHAAELIVLPSDKDTRGVAEAAAEQARAEGLRVSVIPTRSIVQTLAAVAVHDPSTRFDDDVVAMTRAAGATRYAAVTVASRAALTTVGPCEVGDILGLVDGDIVVVGDDVASVTRDILTRMLAIGGELVTLVLGADAGGDLSDDLPQWLAERYPLTDVVVYDGGQPLWPIIMGVE